MDGQYFWDISKWYTGFKIIKKKRKKEEEERLEGITISK